MKISFILGLSSFIVNINLFSAALLPHNAKPPKADIEKVLENKDVLLLFQANYKIAALSPQGIRDFGCVCFYKGLVMHPHILNTQDEKRDVVSSMVGSGFIDKISDDVLTKAGFGFIKDDFTLRLATLDGKPLLYDHYKASNRCVMFAAYPTFVAREERWTDLRGAWIGGVVRGGWARRAARESVSSAAGTIRTGKKQKALNK